MTRLISIREAAQRIGLAECSVRQLCQAGKLRHLRVGERRGRIRIEEADLESYLQAMTNEVVPDPAAEAQRLLAKTTRFAMLKKYGFEVE